LKPPMPAHMASVVKTSRRSEMASITRPNMIGSRMVTIASVMLAAQMKATRFLSAAR
jgi:hypothetical protein